MYSKILNNLDMKIRKLLTLSQFVDLAVKEISIKTGINLPKDINSSNVDDWNTKSIHALGYIRKYNEFIKQPLSKEMFVNELSKDLSLNKKTGEYDKEYLQAEKKVLFEGYGLEIEDDGVWYYGLFMYFRKPLSEFAKMTKGELTLKNVKL